MERIMMPSFAGESIEGSSTQRENLACETTSALSTSGKREEGSSWQRTPQKPERYLKQLASFPPPSPALNSPWRFPTETIGQNGSEVWNAVYPEGDRVSIGYGAMVRFNRPNHSSVIALRWCCCFASSFRVIFTVSQQCYLNEALSDVLENLSGICPPEPRLIPRFAGAYKTKYRNRISPCIEWPSSSTTLALVLRTYITRHNHISPLSFDMSGLLGSDFFQLLSSHSSCI